MTSSSSTSMLSSSSNEIKPIRVFEKEIHFAFILNAFKNKQFANINEIDKLTESLKKSIESQYPATHPSSYGENLILNIILRHSAIQAIAAQFPNHPEILSRKSSYLNNLHGNGDPLSRLLMIDAIHNWKIIPLEKPQIMLGISFYSLLNTNGCLSSLCGSLKNLLDQEQRKYPDLRSIDETVLILQQGFEANKKTAENDIRLARIIIHDLFYGIRASNSFGAARTYGNTPTYIDVLTHVTIYCKKFDPEHLLTAFEMRLAKTAMKLVWGSELKEEALATLNTPTKIYQYLDEHLGEQAEKFFFGTTPAYCNQEVKAASNKAPVAQMVSSSSTFRDTTNLINISECKQPKSVLFWHTYPYVGYQEIEPKKLLGLDSEIEPIRIYGKEIHFAFIINAFKNKQFANINEIDELTESIKKSIESKYPAMQSEFTRENLTLNIILCYSAIQAIIAQFPNNPEISSRKSSYLHDLRTKHDPLADLLMLDALHNIGTPLKEWHIRHGIKFYSLLNINGCLSSFCGSLKDLIDQEQRKYPDLRSIDETVLILQQGFEANKKTAENDIHLARIILHDIFYGIRSSTPYGTMGTSDTLSVCIDILEHVTLSCEKFGPKHFLIEFELFVTKIIMESTFSHDLETLNTLNTPTKIYEYLVEHLNEEHITTHYLGSNETHNKKPVFKLTTQSTAKKNANNNSTPINQESKRPAENKAPPVPPTPGEDIALKLDGFRKPKDIPAEFLDNLAKELPHITDRNVLNRIFNGCRKLNLTKDPIYAAVQQRLKKLTPSSSQPLTLAIATPSIPLMTAPANDPIENEPVKPKREKKEKVSKWNNTTKQKTTDTTPAASTSSGKSPRFDFASSSSSSSSTQRKREYKAPAPSESSSTSSSSTSDSALTPKKRIEEAIKILNNIHRAFNKPETKSASEHELRKLRDAMFGTLADIAIQCEEMWESKEGARSCIFLSKDNAKNLRNWLRHDANGYPVTTWEYCHQLQQACQIVATHLNARQTKVGKYSPTDLFDRNSPSLNPQKNELLRIMLAGPINEHTYETAKAEKALIKAVMRQSTNTDDDINKMAASFRNIRISACDSLLNVRSTARGIGNAIAHSSTLSKHRG